MYPTSVQALPKANAHDTGAFTAASAHSSRQGLLKSMGITGARWGLDGAQAILWLRAIAASGDLDAYWNWHIRPEHQRNHLSKLQNSAHASARTRARRMKDHHETHPERATPCVTNAEGSLPVSR